MKRQRLMFVSTTRATLAALLVALALQQLYNPAFAQTPGPVPSPTSNSKVDAEQLQQLPEVTVSDNAPFGAALTDTKLVTVSLVDLAEFIVITAANLTTAGATNVTVVRIGSQLHVRNTTTATERCKC